MYERSLAIKEKALGPDHPLVAGTLGNMGLVRWKESLAQPRWSVYWYSRCVPPLRISFRNIMGSHRRFTFLVKFKDLVFQLFVS